MAAADVWQRFGRWRRVRPFWGGLLLLLAAFALFFSANLTLADLKVHFGMEGYLSYVLPLVLTLCGVLVWVTPAQRLFYAIIGLITSLYSLIGLNLGGFGAGMILGIVGGALVIAWTPPETGAPAPTDKPAAEGTAAEATAPEGTATGATAADNPMNTTTPGTTTPGTPTAAETAAAETVRQPRHAAPAEEAPPFAPAPPETRGRTHKLLAITLVPLAISAGVLVAGHAPARADDDCPEGVPSRTASATPTPEQTTKPRTKPTTKPATKPADPTTTPTPTPPESADDDRTGNPIVDGWNDFVEGVGDFFGIGDDEESVPADPEKSGTPGGGNEGEDGKSNGGNGKESGTGNSGAGENGTGNNGTGSNGSGTNGNGTGREGEKADPKTGDIPCLGPRVLNKEAAPGDVPPVAVVRGVMEGKQLTMYDSTYDGVTEIPTAQGPKRVLKFSMRKSVTTPFTLTIPERSGRTTLIESGELTTTGNVRFYTPKFEGKLFGLIPVTFTPDSPPPLTLPILTFTDIRIDLAFVRCDTLTAKPLKITELA